MPVSSGADTIATMSSPTAAPQEPPAAWCLVVPVKRLDSAKSRLSGRAAALRAELALAFATDTVLAALTCDRVERVVVVTDDATAAGELTGLGADVVADRPGAGLNPALRHGADVAALPGRGIGALSGDLPSLRSDQLGLALARARGWSASFLRDHSGTGTTLLVAAAQEAFQPAFGPGSARAHLRAGAAEIPPEGLDTVREDVDTTADLDRATRRGVGPRTAQVLSRLPLPHAGSGR